MAHKTRTADSAVPKITPRTTQVEDNDADVHKAHDQLQQSIARLPSAMLPPA
jgi:hypothetical protein